MLKKRFCCFVALLGLSVAAWAGSGLLREQVRTRPAVLYDIYSATCHAALVAGDDHDGNAQVMLALTIEEDNISLGQGDEVILTLQGARRVELQCAHDPEAADVRWRRYPGVDVRQVTLYFPLTTQQLAMLTEADCRTITYKQGRAELRRTVKGVMPAFQRMVRALVAGGFNTWTR